MIIVFFYYNSNYVQVHVSDYVVVKDIVMPHDIIILQLWSISQLDGFYTQVSNLLKCILYVFFIIQN
jgi:hypothetical protein